jgi:hypothetical protein
MASIDGPQSPLCVHLGTTQMTVGSSTPLSNGSIAIVVASDDVVLHPEQEKVARDTIADAEASGLWPGKGSRRSSLPARSGRPGPSTGLTLRDLTAEGLPLLVPGHIRRLRVRHTPLLESLGVLDPDQQCVVERPQPKPSRRTICEALYEHRVLTATQLAQLHFGSLERARKRLTLLHQLGVLGRFRPHRKQGSHPYHYLLDRLGAQLVAAERGLDLADLDWTRAKTLRLVRTMV